MWTTGASCDPILWSTKFGHFALLLSSPSGLQPPNGVLIGFLFAQFSFCVSQLKTRHLFARRSIDQISRLAKFEHSMKLTLGDIESIVHRCIRYSLFHGGVYFRKWRVMNLKFASLSESMANKRSLGFHVSTKMRRYRKSATKRVWIHCYHQLSPPVP